MANAAQVDGGRSGIPWRAIGWGIAVILLAIPFVMMRISSEWNWSPGDFVFAGVMIGGTGLLLELTVRSSSNRAYRSGVATALLATFLLIWINGAVGIIGDEGGPANMMFIVVILLALAGSIAGRFRPDGMMRAMFVAAGTQLLVGVIAFALGLGADEPPGRWGTQGLNGVFVLLWLFSAGLFRKAAETVG